MTQTTTPVFTKDFLIEVANGNVPGYSYVQKAGARAAVGATITPITSAGVYQTPSTLTSLEMVSTDNTNDIGGGTGALTVTVTGLGTGWTELSETVTLNGTTAVALANQYYRIYDMYVASSGTYGTASAPSHNSTITLQVSGAGAVWATIIPDGSFGLGDALIACYTVPLGKTAYLISDHTTVEAAKTPTVYRFFRENCNDVTTPFSPIRVQDLNRVGEGGDRLNMARGPYVGPCDIGYMGVISASTANIEVDFDLILVNT